MNPEPGTTILSRPTIELPSVIRNEAPWDTEADDEALPYEVLVLVCL